MPSVCLDAFNIALPKGSGIATYGRNLIQDLGAVGIEAQLLYGPHGPIGDSRLLDTVALTDAPAPITAAQRKESGIDAKPKEVVQA